PRRRPHGFSDRRGRARTTAISAAADTPYGTSQACGSVSWKEVVPGPLVDTDRLNCDLVVHMPWVAANSCWSTGGDLLLSCGRICGSLALGSVHGCTFSF